MMEKKAVYKCEVCGNVVESLWNGKPPVVCCNKPMVKLEANTVDAATEKHVPVIIREGNTVTVKVGEVDHPMTEKHYIVFAEVVAGNKVYRQDFTPEDEKAQATFLIEETDIIARAYCNLHGFWRGN
ncbi:MAG: desulfoferrodoxin [Chitinispirillia bacterium]|jgi:superoxide reductase